MKNFFFIPIIFLLSLTTGISFASDNFTRCFFNPKPKINFHSSLGKLKYDFTKNTDEISALTDRRAVGLALRRIGSTMKVEWNMMRNGKGYCVVPKVIDVYIGVGRPKIYVTNEWEKDSCDYLLTLRHEQAHIQTTIRLVEHFVKTAPIALELATQEIRPIYVPKEMGQSGINEAGRIILEEYNEVVKNLQNKLDAEIEKEQVKIDDPRLKGLHREVCFKHRKREEKNRVTPLD